ncbi:glycoside hydrolase family 10 protein, partial [Pantoea sp.]|uniref:glycoside hydrolase family 10 protein n=1 Tax=Pantoea sp. TaxID=69393 RepID=UPI003917E55F
MELIIATLVKKLGYVVASALLLASCSSEPPKSLVTPFPPVAKQPLPAQHPVASQEPVRGVWLATVSRLDWPPVNSVNASSAASRISQQQQALTDKLDKLKSLGINTVFFQVKPDGTALWPSKILPWSDMLTGKIGADPGYDPLQFMLDEAHKRGMKVHAWFNPYRVSVNTKASTVAELNATLSLNPASVFVLHRDWIRTAGDRFVLDPGIPAVRDWITSIVAEVVSRYPVD